MDFEAFDIINKLTKGRKFTFFEKKCKAIAQGQRSENRNFESKR